MGNPPASPLIVQNSLSVFGFNAPVTTTYQSSTSVTTSLANSVTRHLELPDHEEPLLNGDKLVNSSSSTSNDSHGAIHHNTPINGM